MRCRGCVTGDDALRQCRKLAAARLRNHKRLTRLCPSLHIAARPRTGAGGDDRHVGARARQRRHGRRRSVGVRRRHGGRRLLRRLGWRVAEVDDILAGVGEELLAKPCPNKGAGAEMEDSEG